MDTTINLPATVPHPIALLQPAISVPTVHSVFVLDPDFPAIEPHPTANLDISRFSATFRVPFTSSLGVNHVHALSLPELLACYSIPSAAFDALPPATTAPDLAAALSTCCPFQFGQCLVDQLLDIHLFTHLDASNSPTEFITRSLSSTTTASSRPITSSLDWSSAYQQDTDTRFMLQHLQSELSFSLTDLSQVHSTYCDYIRQEHIAIVDQRIVVFQPVQNNTERLMLIVVLQSLRREVFSAYHTAPIAGHMGVYKTLHPIRLRFFWPHSQKDVTNWVLQCPHCIAANDAVSCNSELTFSWPLCCPFYVLLVNLWAPGDIANYRGDTCLLNAMCNLTGFVLVSATSNITAQDLPRLFVQDVLLKIGFCGVVVVDDGSTFKGLF
jgi:hypothetical protein